MQSFNNITIEGILIGIILSAIGSIVAWFVFPPLRERVRGVFPKLEITAPILLGWIMGFIMLFSIIILTLIGKEVPIVIWIAFGFTLCFLITHAIIDSEDR